MRTSLSLQLFPAAALTLLLALPAAAQGGGGGGRGGFGGGRGRVGQRPAPATVDPAAERDAELVREIHLIRVLSQGKISRDTLEQLRELLPAITQAA